MKGKKLLTLGLAAVMLTGVFGCGSRQTASESTASTEAAANEAASIEESRETEATTTSEADAEPVTISVGNWPDETRPDVLADYNRVRDGFMEKYPYITVEGDTYAYDPQTFTMKAAAKQLPTMFTTYFTEVSSIINSGYAADLTDALKANGWYDSMNPELRDLITGADGELYGVPTDAYAQGLYINKKLFEEAGLVNEDGSVMVPQTFEELGEFAQTIKEKTGKAGFVMPTTNNQGGWHFLNIAWAFGVEFMTQDENGKWQAAFDTQEARDALQFVKDLRWKYDALLDDTVIDLDKMNQYFGTYQAAMMFNNPPGKLTQNYGTEIGDIYVTRMPAGPAGRFSQMGGNLYMFTADATPEQIDAGLKFLEYWGRGPELTDEQAESLSLTYKSDHDSGAIVMDRDAFNVWVNEDTINKKIELRSEYTNVDPADYADYYAFEDVTIKPEPSVCAQELYAVLDGCIQEVITNENADVDQLITDAAHDFQVNHLDKLEY